MSKNNNIFCFVFLYFVYMRVRLSRSWQQLLLLFFYMPLKGFFVYNVKLDHDTTQIHIKPNEFYQR